jgi:RimJ/RimL family protein N-acetyltransferase
MENGVNNIVLTSERLLFRKHVLADLDDFCAMEQDADVRRYVGGYPRTREAAEERFKDGLARANADRLGMWATVLKSTGQYIGRCGIYPSFGHDNQPIAGEAALGLYIAKSFWGQGYATEAVLDLMR